MGESDKGKGGKSGKRETQAAREKRLRAALRENLKRRKAQARGRADGHSPSGQRSAPATEGQGKD